MDKWLDQNESLGADHKGPCKNQVIQGDVKVYRMAAILMQLTSREEKTTSQKHDGPGRAVAEKKLAVYAKMDRQYYGRHEHIWNDIWHYGRYTVLEIYDECRHRKM